MESKSVFEKIGDWCRNHNLCPYFKLRNFSDPLEDRARDLDPDCVSDGKTGVEAGLKITF